MKNRSLDKYYKSRVHSGSIIIVRRVSDEEKASGESLDGYDYKVLLLKRNMNLVFGGYYAFSGGKVED